MIVEMLRIVIQKWKMKKKRKKMDVFITFKKRIYFEMGRIQQTCNPTHFVFSKGDSVDFL